MSIDRERYLAAATYLSSRSFPSTILSATPSLAPTAGVTIQPVLLPGIDVFNHARRRAVSWVVNNASPTTPPDEPTSSDLSISLVLHDPIGRGQELYNNYGPKPNAQFILAFGFTLPQNPDDTIVLKVGGANIQGAKWEIGRGARGMDGLWQELLNVAGAPESKEGGHEFEAELDAAEMLHDMAYDLISRLPKPDGLPSDMRSEVYTMWKDYVEGDLNLFRLQLITHPLIGQRDILESVVMFAEEREKEAIAAAKQQGIEIVREGED